MSRISDFYATRPSAAANAVIEAALLDATTLACTSADHEMLEPRREQAAASRKALRAFIARVEQQREGGS